MTARVGKFLRSLRGQLALIWLALLLLVVALFALFLVGESGNHRAVVALSNEAIKALAKDGLMQRGQQLATQFASNVAQPLAEGNEQDIELISRVALNQPDVRYVMVFDRQGRIVNAGDSTSTVGQPMVDPLADAALLADALKAQWTDDLLDVAMPVRVGGERIGGVRVGLVVSGPSATQANLLAPITGHMELAEPVAAALGGDDAGVCVAVWRVSRPSAGLAHPRADPEPRPDHGRRQAGPVLAAARRHRAQRRDRRSDARLLTGCAPAWPSTTATSAAWPTPTP